MDPKRPLSLALAVTLITLLVISPSTLFPQVDPGWDMPVRIFELLDPGGTRLATVVVAGESGRSFEEGNEYWTFSEEALLDVAEQGSLEMSILAQGEWTDRWVVEALAWRPADPVTFSHPATVEWDDGPPPVVPGGVYFGNATLGGLMIQYSPRGASSLTWLKLTEGPYMLLGDGAVFEQDEDVPETGTWWQGAM